MLPLRASASKNFGFAYWVLQQIIIASEGHASVLKKAIGTDWKGKLSPLLYIAAIAKSASEPLLLEALYLHVAVNPEE